MAVRMIESTLSDGVCVLRLSAPPANTITFPLLDELRAAIRRANAQDEIRGIVLTGRPDHFSAGADVGLFRDLVRPEEAVRTSRVFQEAMQIVEDSAKPVAAAVAGRVMGSALELAAACHYRVCTRATRFSMPEVTLGINPGAGGTQRLPRLVGVDEALKMLLTGEAVSAERGRAIGLVDAISEGDDLLDVARTVLRSAPGPRKTSAYADKVCDAAANEAAFERARQRIAAMRPEIIAPRVIMEAVRVGLAESFDAGLRKEQEGFAACMATPATRNKIYLFFATREVSKIPVSAAVSVTAPEIADIKSAAVIGMGSMGTGIAQALMAGGVRVAVLDQDAAALKKGAERIRSSIRGRVEQGRLAPDAAEAMLGLLSTTADWREIAGVPLVIEAVFEDTTVKRGVLAKVEAACGEAAIIASNTSTISLDVLAEGLLRPERLVGMHFFNPAHHMPLVEVIRRGATADGVVAAALGFVKSIRKTPVLVRNREGFLVNRLFIPYLKEAFWLLEEGADAPAIDSAMVEFGFPMGPLALIDMAGLDILVLTDRVLSRAFPAHGPLSQVVERLVACGHAGQKSGSGVYRYEKGDRTPIPSAAAAQIVAEVRQAAGRTPRPAGKDEIARRCVLRMVSEAFYVMEEGIAQRESDVDVAMVLGTGFPDFRGGVIRYARDLGLGRVRADLDELAAEHGARFSPCPLLRNMEGV
jgi:3-hydroxyacyl-CoA dehydrogenase